MHRKKAKTVNGKSRSAALRYAIAVATPCATRSMIAQNHAQRRAVLASIISAADDEQTMLNLSLSTNPRWSIYLQRAAAIFRVFWEVEAHRCSASRCLKWARCRTARAGEGIRILHFAMCVCRVVVLCIAMPMLCRVVLCIAFASLASARNFDPHPRRPFEPLARQSALRLLRQLTTEGCKDLVSVDIGGSLLPATAEPRSTPAPPGWQALLAQTPRVRHTTRRRASGRPHSPLRTTILC